MEPIKSMLDLNHCLISRQSRNCSAFWRSQNRTIDTVFDQKSSWIDSCCWCIGFFIDYASRYYTFRIKGETLPNIMWKFICIDVLVKRLFLQLSQSDRKMIHWISSRFWRNPQQDRLLSLLTRVMIRRRIISSSIRWDRCQWYRLSPMYIMVYTEKDAEKISELIYHKRSLVETVFSVMKRKFADRYMPEVMKWESRKSVGLTLSTTCTGRLS